MNYYIIFVTRVDLGRFGPTWTSCQHIHLTKFNYFFKVKLFKCKSITAEAFTVHKLSMKPHFKDLNYPFKL